MEKIVHINNLIIQMAKQHGFSWSKYTGEHYCAKDPYILTKSIGKTRSSRLLILIVGPCILKNNVWHFVITEEAVDSRPLEKVSINIRCDEKTLRQLLMEATPHSHVLTSMILSWVEKL